MGAQEDHDGWLKKGYWGLVQGENSLRHVLLLIIRLYWGVLFILTGLGKLMNGAGVSEYFTTLHLPYPLFFAYLVGSFELLGGISLVFGFLSRFFSLFLTIILCTAYGTAHREVFHQAIQNFPSQFILQEPFLFLYASLVVLCFGPGLFSFDYWIEKRNFNQAL